jgi:hypothetical protein
MRVTKNLFEALQCFRSRSVGDKLLLWADAVCIDQSNLVERADQVRIMGEIYQKASSVWIWTGKSDENSREAFRIIREVWEISQKFKGNVFSMEELAEGGLPNVEMSSWNRIERFVWRVWFTRVWVIQEICMAKTAYFVSSPTDFIESRVFFTTLDFICASVIQAATGMQFGSTPFLARLNMAMWYDRPRDLLNLLMDTRSYRATDKRDKIFAILNLCNTGESDLISPDYTKSAAETYTLFTKNYISRFETLDILSAVCDPIWRGRRRVPSWVPDWNTSPRTTEFLRRSAHTRIDVGATGLSHSPANAEFSADGRTLSVHGIVLDSISHCYRPWLFYGLGETSKQLATLKTLGFLGEITTKWMSDGEDGSGGTIMRMGMRLQLWETGLRRTERRAKSDVYPPTGESWITAFLKTITGSVLGTKTADVVDLIPEQTESSPHNNRAVDASHDSKAVVSGTSDIKNASGTSEPAIDAENLESFYESFCMASLLKARTRPLTSADLERSSMFSRAFHRTVWGRNFVVTKKHHLCITPYSSRPGDTIVLLKGGKTPYVIRKKLGKWLFVGECYVYGINDERWKEADVGTEKFTFF